MYYTYNVYRYYRYVARAGDFDAPHLMHDILITSVKAEHARGRNDVFKSCL